MCLGMQLTSLSPLLLQALLQHILLRSRNRCLAPQMQHRRFSIHCYPLLFYKVRVRTYVLRIRRTSEEHQYLFGAGWQTLPSGKPQRESSNGKAPTGKLQRESILIVAFDSNLICLCREGKRERDIPYSGCPGV